MPISNAIPGTIALLQPLLREEADVVFGSRYLRWRGVRSNWRLTRIGVVLLNAFALAVWCPADRRSDLFQGLFDDGWRKWELECERFQLPRSHGQACRLGLSILEVPIRYHPRTVAEGKKDPVDGRMEGSLDLVEISKMAESWAGARVRSESARDLMGLWVVVGERTGIMS